MNREFIKLENKYYNYLSDCGFSPCGTFTGCHIKFFDNWLTFKTWADAVSFVNEI